MQANVLRWATAVGAAERALLCAEMMRDASTYFERIRIVNDALGPNWVFRLVDLVGVDTIRASRPSWHEFYVQDHDGLHMPLDPGAPETRDYLGDDYSVKDLAFYAGMGFDGYCLALLVVPISVSSYNASMRGAKKYLVGVVVGVAFVGLLIYTTDTFRSEAPLVEREEHYIELLAEDPLDSLAWYQLARIDFLRGDFVSARFKINKQLELHGVSEPRAYYVRGLINGFDEKYETAERDFSIYIALVPDTVYGRVDLGWIYLAQGKFNEAEQVAREGLIFDPTNVWLLNLRGVALLNRGEKQEAARYLEAALAGAYELEPEDWSVVYPGNDPRIAQGSLEEMRRSIEKNLELARVD